MRTYGKVTPTFWTRGDGRALRGDPEAQVMALYLFSCPSASATGIFYLPLPTICHETGLPIEGASKALQRVCEHGIAFYDEKEDLVWIPKMARYQIGETLKTADKQRPYVVQQIAAFKGHRFYEHFLFLYAVPYNLDPSMGHGSPLEAPSMGDPPQQEQGKSRAGASHKQEGEHEGEKKAAGVPLSFLPPGKELPFENPPSALPDEDALPGIFRDTLRPFCRSNGLAEYHPLLDAIRRSAPAGYWKIIADEIENALAKKAGTLKDVNSFALGVFKRWASDRATKEEVKTKAQAEVEEAAKVRAAKAKKMLEETAKAQREAEESQATEKAQMAALDALPEEERQAIFDAVKAEVPAFVGLSGEWWKRQSVRRLACKKMQEVRA